MKATLEFNFPEDESSYKLALAAPELYDALCNIQERLRSQMKYAKISRSAVKELEALREFIPYELLERL